MLQGFNSRFEQAGERARDPKGKAESISCSRQKGKRMTENEQSPRKLQGTMKYISVSIMGVPERQKGAGKVFEKNIRKQLSKHDEIHEYIHSRNSNYEILRGKDTCKFMTLCLAMIFLKYDTKNR